MERVQLGLDHVLDGLEHGLALLRDGVIAQALQRAQARDRPRARACIAVVRLLTVHTSAVEHRCVACEESILPCAIRRKCRTPPSRLVVAGPMCGWRTS